MEEASSNCGQGAVSLDEYMRLQRELICSPENRWFTGEEVKHDPDENELVMHWLRCGAGTRFRESFGRPPAPPFVENE